MKTLLPLLTHLTLVTEIKTATNTITKETKAVNSKLPTLLQDCKNINQVLFVLNEISTVNNATTLTNLVKKTISQHRFAALVPYGMTIGQLKGTIILKANPKNAKKLEDIQLTMFAHIVTFLTTPRIEELEAAPTPAPTVSAIGKDKTKPEELLPKSDLKVIPEKILTRAIVSNKDLQSAFDMMSKYIKNTDETGLSTIEVMLEELGESVLDQLNELSDMAADKAAI